MLIINKRNKKEKDIKKKKELGQFFTKENVWLKEHILDFIKKHIQEFNKITCFDPFAWQWDLLNIGIKIWFTDYYWFDIDENLSWDINNSLISIPYIENSFIITNPPYLAKNVAKRKNLLNKEDFKLYYNKYDDLYKLALDKIFENNKCWIAIIPETFINSSFNKKNIYSITILEDNPFIDTEVPVCVICFTELLDFSDIKIYKNDKFIWNFKNLKSIDLIDNYWRKINRKENKLNNEGWKKINIKFNDLKWNIVLKAIDGISKNQEIKFSLKENYKYNFDDKIKSSSRNITLINIEWYNNIDNKKNKENLINLIEKLNKEFNLYRERTQDIFLSPFKGNNKIGQRRRRLDFGRAKWLIENVILNS